MKKLAVLSLLAGILAIGGTTACAARSSSSDKVVREDRNPGAFTGIAVSTGINLTITDQVSGVVVEAKEKYIANIITQVEKGVLVVKVKPLGKNGWKGTKGPINVFVPVGPYTKLSASSGSSMKLPEELSSTDVVMSSSSGSSIKGGINCNNLAMSSASGSAIKLKCTADALSADASSGSEIRLEGTADRISASTSSGSSLRGPEFTVRAPHAKRRAVRLSAWA